jgi:hypothetical protein
VPQVVYCRGSGANPGHRCGYGCCCCCCWLRLQHRRHDTKPCPPAAASRMCERAAVAGQTTDGAARESRSRGRQKRVASASRRPFLERDSSVTVWGMSGDVWGLMIGTGMCAPSYWGRACPRCQSIPASGRSNNVSNIAQITMRRRAVCRNADGEGMSTGLAPLGVLIPRLCNNRPEDVAAGTSRHVTSRLQSFSAHPAPTPFRDQLLEARGASRVRAALYALHGRPADYCVRPPACAATPHALKPPQIRQASRMPSARAFRCLRAPEMLYISTWAPQPRQAKSRS